MGSKNVTLSLDADLLLASKRYASVRGTSLNGMLRDYLQRTVLAEDTAQSEEKLLEALDGAAGDSKGKRWKREDAYSG